MTMPTESADGRPHLTYYDPETQMSFVWSGRRDNPIEVSHGGYGEPVIATIALPEGHMSGDAQDVVNKFGDLCARWLAARPTGVVSVNVHIETDASARKETA